MIRTTLTLRVASVEIDRVLDYFRNNQVLQYSLDHSDALASEISVATDGSGDVMVTALWPSLDAYQGWLSNPWRDASNDRLAVLLKDAVVGVGRTFQIDHEVHKD